MNEQPPEKPTPETEPRKKTITERIKDNMSLILWILGIAAWLGINYYLVDYYGKIMLWGYIVTPVWVGLIYYFLDRESSLLIEVSIEGDIIDEKGELSSPTTDTRLFKIPSPKWKTLTMKGYPFRAGEKVYICDRYDDKTETVYFPDTPGLSNINAYLRNQVWLDIKDRLKFTTWALAKYRWLNGVIADERAVDMLENFGILRDFVRETDRGPEKLRKYSVTRRRVVKKEDKTPIPPKVVERGAIPAGQ